MKNRLVKLLAVSVALYCSVCTALSDAAWRDQSPYAASPLAYDLTYEDILQIYIE